ncbi:MAG: coproporphyrinogen dehydrogenase HemZ [Epulopiscium sp.]|nr:coproporphyrinogen dehydrogenase HemZ [Candidatus Epulonipiscium sp.]
MIDIELVGHEYHYEIENIIKVFEGYIQEAKIRSILRDNLCRAEIYQKEQLIVVKEEEGSLDQKHTKQQLIRTLYHTLCEVTGVKMPWGFLTGIRPTKIVHEMFEHNMPREDIKKRLLEFYDIREDKVELMIKVAEKEKSILEKNQEDEISVYIGIPFCPTRCLYCSFTSYAIDHREKQVEGYLDALEKEIIFGGKYSSNKKIRSIYIGGGTPTALNEDQLERLLMLVNQHFNVKDAEEFTVEAGRPDTITKRKLEILKQYHVNRISINPQTMNEETLVRIGRKHTTEDIVKVFNWAREIGHHNINMDLIVGLPGESPEDVKNTMVKIKELNPDSITVHTMAIKRASRLRESLEEYTLTKAEEIEDMIFITSQGAYDMGMEPYYLYRQKNMLGNFENAGYCKSGKESVYNIEIMEEKETILALGAGAITKVVDPITNRIERIPNVKNVEEYINRIDEMILRKQKGLKDLDNVF